jgi:hypothetical protein
MKCRPSLLIALIVALVASGFIIASMAKDPSLRLSGDPLREKCIRDMGGEETLTRHYDDILRVQGNANKGATGADLAKLAIDLCVSMELQKAQGRR